MTRNFSSPPWSAALAATILIPGHAEASELTGQDGEPKPAVPIAEGPAQVRIAIVAGALPEPIVADALGSTSRERFEVALARTETFSFDQWYRARSSSGYDINVWLLGLGENVVGIYFATTVGDRFIARELRISSPLDELDREALAQVLETSLQALDEQAVTPMSRREAASLFGQTSPRPKGDDSSPPPQEVARTAPPPSRTLATFRRQRPLLPEVRVAYRLSRHSSDGGLLHGLGLRGGIDHIFASGFAGLGLEARYVLPSEFEERELVLDHRALVTRLELRGARFLGPPGLALGTYGGLGLTTTFWSARSSGSLQTEAGSNSTTPTLSWGIFGQLRSSEVSRFEFGLGLEVDLRRERYAIEDAQGLDVFLSRDFVRPGAHLGICLF